MKIHYKVKVVWPSSKGVTPPFVRKFGTFGEKSLRGACARVIEQVSKFTPARAVERTKSLTFYVKAELNKDGGYSGLSNITQDPRVVVKFDLDGVDYTIPCDAFSSSPQNLCAIAKTIEGLRANERYGVMTLKQMMEGVAELPQVSSATRPIWFDVLGVDRMCSLREAETAYRKLAVSRHPDAGGTHTEWLELQEAITTARQVCK